MNMTSQKTLQSLPTTRPPRQRMIVRAQLGCDKNVQTGTTTRRRVLAALPPCGCAACAASASASVAGRNDTLDKLFAASMASGMAEYEANIAPLKRMLFAELLGGLPPSQAGPEAADGVPPPAQLLELGVGTGPNLTYYSQFYGLPEGSTVQAASSSSSSSSGGDSPSAGAPPPLHITGVDPNPYMREYLQQNLAASGWPEERFAWVQGRAEALPLADASIDAAVCTLVLCSVEAVGPVLDELARVLKPGGSLLFIEHTTARFQAQPLLWLGQRALEPLQRALADNCHLSRDPLPALEVHPAFAGGVAAQRLAVDGVSFISPHVAGIAQKQA